jgi:uncharacterized protein (TIRG00374 family)
MKRIASRVLQVVLPLAVSVFFVWLSIRGVDLGEVIHAIRGAHVGWILAYVGINVAIHLVRTVRWGLLLEPIGRVRFWDLNVASGGGFMALTVLPLRLGELARSFLVKRLAGIRMSASMATVVIERVVDTLVIALLVMVLLFGVRGGERVVYLRTAGTLLFLGFTALLVGLLLAYRLRERAVRLVGRALHPLSAKLASCITGLLDSFIHGLRVVPSSPKIAVFFALTAAYWGLNAVALSVLGQAFGIELGLREALTVLGIQMVGIMIPAGPGMLGTFQFFLVLGLSLFVPGEVMRVQGAAYAHTAWGLTLATQLVVGMGLLSFSDIRFSSLLSGGGEVSDPEGPTPENRLAG